ncbi:hypothetical protein BTVI_40275 [Pitangus sulphuratus]|nr:hypothetical protein BTVI_40275 [Pitangus sulphuratus]
MDRKDLHPEAGVVRTSEVLRSITPAELWDLRKDYSRQPGERILTWLVRCWDNGARSHILEGHEAQQLRSLARDCEIKQGIPREPYNHSLWLQILNVVRDIYPFKEYLTSSPGKWMTAEGGVQYLRELAMLELIYCNPDYFDILDPANLPCTNPMWRKVIKGVPAPYVNCLISVFHPKGDKLDVEIMCQWIRSIVENLGDLSDVQRQPTRSRERMERYHEYSRYEDDYEDRDDEDYRDYRDRPGENMKKWDGQPTSKLGARVRELKQKEANKKFVYVVNADFLEKQLQSPRHKKAEVHFRDNKKASGFLRVDDQQVPIATTTVHRREYQTNQDAVIPIHKMIRKLESQGVVSKTHSPFNSPIWPVRKSDGEWRPTVDYRGLNEVTLPLSADGSDMLELQYELESKTAKWHTTIDIANAFFSIPLAAECRLQFAFTWRGCRINLLEKGEAPEHIQYIDDIIVWGDTAKEVFKKGQKIIQILLKAGFTIKKTMAPPTNKKEIQAFLGAIGFWRMHHPEYSQTVSPPYLVTHKKSNFQWGPEQQQAFRQIKQKIAHAMALGPVRTGPDIKNVLYSAAGDNSPTWNLWQKVPGETQGRPLGFWSRSYRGSEANYTPMENEILAAYEGIQAASEMIGTEAQLFLALQLLEGTGSGKQPFGVPPNEWQRPLKDIASRVKKLDVRGCHVPKSRINEEHHNNRQADLAAQIEVSQVDLDWQHKGELFLA